MKRKKLIAGLLCAACVSSLLTAPTAAATVTATVSTFSDVSDPVVGQAVEVLRTMGVVDGVPGGGYNPSGTLTRGEFCKLVVLTMGRGDDVDAYASKTIFPDVASKHWARGYINLASSIDVGGSTDKDGNVSGASRLIMGIGNGTFAPNRTITYAEAITILLRVLGYTAAANTNWPSGALSTAKNIGLADNLGSPQAASTLSRGQAGILFYNMLLTNPKGTTSIYASSLGSIEESTLLLACSTKADDGSEGAVKTLKYTKKAAANTPASFFQGKKGTAVFNADGLFLTFLPDKGATSKSITTSGATASVLTASDGTKLTLSASTKVWYNNEEKAYNEIYASLNRSGITVTVFYTAAGAVDYLYVGSVASSASNGALVAKDKVSGNPFASLTGGTTGYTILKNGIKAAVSDIRQYDVGVFDTSANTLYVSDFRLTGVYQDASPNAAAPSKVKMFGQWFDVLDSAISDLKDFSINSTITLLFTADGKVAGAVSTSEARSTAVGVVTEVGSEVTVELLDTTATAKVTGKFSGTSDTYLGYLVTVNSMKDGYLGLTKLTGGSSTSAFDVKNKTIGGAALAENVNLFEKVGNSAIARINLSDLTADTVSASKIAYMRKNYAGKIDLLVLDDATGDRYTYGIITTVDNVTTDTASDGTKVQNSFTTVNNKESSIKVIGKPTIPFGRGGSVTTGEDGTVTTIGNPNYSEGVGGIVQSLDMFKKTYNTASSFMKLNAVSGATQANFNTNTKVFFSGALELPIADNVQCYNGVSKSWFSSLSECLSYSNRLTVYYDRTPNEGGKVRLIVAN